MTHSDPRFGLPNTPLSDNDGRWTPPRLPDILTINGAAISGRALMQILSGITNPDPKHSYRCERQGDMVVVEPKRDE